jgi:hypothetical protein
MSAYPEDVMRAAEEAARDECQAGGSFDYRCVVETAARAILAERERAAKVVETTSPKTHDAGLHGEELAAAIRKGDAS